jgi:hypothetical protein
MAAIVAPPLRERLANIEPFVDLRIVQQGLLQIPGVRFTAVNVSVNKFFSNSHATTTQHIFTSRVFLSKRVISCDPLANQLARTILNRDPSVENEDIIAISIIYGYDIGIASSWRTQNFSFSPAQWRKRFTPV